MKAEPEPTRENATFTLEREEMARSASDVLIGVALGLAVAAVVGLGVFVGVRQGWIWGAATALLVGGALYALAVACAWSSCVQDFSGLESIDRLYPPLRYVPFPAQNARVGPTFA